MLHSFQLLSKLTKTTTPSSPEEKKGLSAIQAIALAAYSLSEAYYLNPQLSSSPNDLFKAFHDEGKQNILGNVVVLHGGDIETSLRLLGNNNTLSSPSLPSTLFFDDKQALDYVPALYNAIRNSSNLTVHMQRSYAPSASSLYDLGFVVFFSGSPQQAHDTAVIVHLVGSMYALL